MKLKEFVELGKLKENDIKEICIVLDGKDSSNPNNVHHYSAGSMVIFEAHEVAYYKLAYETQMSHDQLKVRALFVIYIKERE